MIILPSFQTWELYDLPTLRLGIQMVPENG